MDSYAAASQPSQRVSMAEETNDETKTGGSTINENLLGDRFLPFGNLYIHAPNLLKGYLSLRTEKKGYIKSRPLVPISLEMKNIILDVVFKNKFEENKYLALKDDEKDLFDDICAYSRLSTHTMSRMVTNSQKKKKILIDKFNVFKGEILAGNNNIQIIKDMRNILLELNAKKLVSKIHYDRLMSEIMACI